MTGWISVKEQLPKDITFIIAYGKRSYELQYDGTPHEEPSSVWNAFYSLGEFYCFCGDINHSIDVMEASHWMPLPEPPHASK